MKKESSFLKNYIISKYVSLDCQGFFFPECQKRIHAESKEVERIECWGKPLYAYCKAMDGHVFHIPGFYCEHSTCPTDAILDQKTKDLLFQVFE